MNYKTIEVEYLKKATLFDVLKRLIVSFSRRKVKKGSAEYIRLTGVKWAI